MTTLALVTGIISLVVSLYGAVLATYLGVRRIQSQQSKAFVSYGWQYSLGSNGHMEDTPNALILYAVNDGSKDIVFESIGIEIDGIPTIIVPAFLNNFREENHNKEHGDNTKLRCGEKVQVALDNHALWAAIRYFESRFSQARERPLTARAVLQGTFDNYFVSEWFELEHEVENDGLDRTESPYPAEKLDVIIYKGKVGSIRVSDYNN